MLLSIIIPAKNEEVLLPKLLKSIKEQKFTDYEVIIADAGSTDRTKEVARSYGAKVIKGGLPARGRNAGAEAAQGELLLFLDADVILPENFLEKAIDEFKARKLDAACSPAIPITDSKKIKVFFDLAYNLPIAKLEKISPHGAWAILAKKDLCRRVKGYDEGLKLREDHDFVKRLARAGEFRILKNAKILISLRRFRQDGWLNVIVVYALSELYGNLIGPIKKDIFKYKFGHYSKDIKD